MNTEPSSVDRRRREIFALAADELTARVQRRVVARRTLAGMAVCASAGVIAHAMLRDTRPGVDPSVVPGKPAVIANNTGQTNGSAKTIATHVDQEVRDESPSLEHPVLVRVHTGRPTGSAVRTTVLTSRGYAVPNNDEHTGRVIVRRIDDEQMLRLFADLGLSVGIVRVGSQTLVVDNRRGRPVFEEIPGKVEHRRLGNSYGEGPE